MPRVPPSSTDDYEIDKLRTPDFTHECQDCGQLAEVDDHQTHTPNWCSSCEDITTFEKLESCNGEREVYE